jgi:hypothetical protein
VACSLDRSFAACEELAGALSLAGFSALLGTVAFIADHIAADDGKTYRRQPKELIRTRVPSRHQLLVIVSIRACCEAPLRCANLPSFTRAPIVHLVTEIGGTKRSPRRYSST